MEVERERDREREKERATIGGGGGVLGQHIFVRIKDKDTERD